MPPPSGRLRSARGPTVAGVVGTRCQAPSGAGYALENRVTIAHCSRRFAPSRPHALASPSGRSRTLLAWSPSDGSAHRAAHAGAPAWTYFEHLPGAYLGFTLVGGSDLAVRRPCPLKTVKGLGVRWDPAPPRRRLCDPMELRNDSAWRAGTRAGVSRRPRAVANALAWGLESPALLAFLPAICERLFGEPVCPLRPVVRGACLFRAIAPVSAAAS